MRIDKFLKVSRILKRRTVSKELAVNQRIEINGRIVKPAHDVAAGDTVSITFGNRKLTVRGLSVEEVKKKKDASELYEIISEEKIASPLEVETEQCYKNYIEENMAKKRKKKLNSKFVAFIALGLAMAMLLAVGREIMTTLQLRKQMAEAKEKLAQTQEENELLVEEKTKLQDPDYVESYARSNYMFSKDGEQIFFLPDKTDKKQNESNK